MTNKSGNRQMEQMRDDGTDQIQATDSGAWVSAFGDSGTGHLAGNRHSCVLQCLCLFLWLLLALTASIRRQATTGGWWRRRRRGFQLF